MKRQVSPGTVYVGMSGGVDSSVAAALLKKRGFSVVGVFMKPWQPTKGEVVCLWKEDREYAMRAAAALNIPFETWDFSKDYKREVADYMIEEYKAGRTPNPDVMCNKEIKFGLFLRRALKEGADYVATGHYARVKKTNSGFSLLAGKDKNKDQSYFLWTLTQAQLSKILFPVGDLEKLEVRKLAKKFKLPNFDKKDSQGVCFIGTLDMKEFLKHYIKSKPGNIVDEHGTVIGIHEGSYYYTIGQRHGLDIKNGQGPYYVTAKDLKKNIVYVGKEEQLLSSEARISGLNWIEPQIKFPLSISSRLRYRAKLKKAALDKSGKLKLLSPERAITSGQSAVFYKGDRVLGGGIVV
jgi:tRNA-uridine 2-sulfurtransferase